MIAGIVRVEVDMHTTYLQPVRRFAKLKDAAEASARRLPAMPGLAIVTCSECRAFDDDMVTLFNDLERVSVMSNALYRRAKAFGHICEGRPAIADAKFWEVNLDIIRKQLNDAGVSRVGLLEIGGGQIGLL